MENITFEIKQRKRVVRQKIASRDYLATSTSKTYMYLRGSTIEIDLENQRREIQKYAKSKLINIDYTLSETVSGSVKATERQLGALIENAKAGDMILVTEFSRIGRSLTDVLSTLQAAHEKGVQITVCRLDLKLDNSIAAKTMAFAFSLAAEIERSLISERTKAGLQKALANGKKLGRPRGSGEAATAPRKLDAHKKRIEELLSAGVSCSAIGRILGVHRLTVTAFIEDRIKNKKR